MKDTFKVFMVKDDLYLVSDENVIIGDKAIVTVEDRFPSVVECQNNDQIKLFQESRLKSTKRYKVLEKLNTFDNDLKKHFDENNDYIFVEVEDGKITIKETEE